MAEEEEEEEGPSMTTPPEGSCATFQISDEGHSLGNALRFILNKECAPLSCANPLCRIVQPMNAPRAGSPDQNQYVMPSTGAARCEVLSATEFMNIYDCCDFYQM
jgi:hypothetical protein